MGILTFPQENFGKVKDPTLSSQLSVLGSYPFTNEADIRIGSYTEWGDDVGYRKVGVLTIGAGQTLRITRSPFIIFAKEIIFESTTSTISANGWHGSEYTKFATTTLARGGGVTTSDVASGGAIYGGCGGGMLFIITDRISGAVGNITAHGGNGAVLTRILANYSYACGGQGALSNAYPTSTTAGSSSARSIDLVFSASPFTVTSTLDTLINRPEDRSTNFMGRAGIYRSGIDPVNNVFGGASGDALYAGSGFGAGGSCGYNNSPGYTGNGTSAANYPPLQALIPLWDLKCRGGGGGAALQGSSQSGVLGPAAAGGGGGGLVHVWVSKLDAMPLLIANGGTGTQIQANPYPDMTGGHGAAGMTGFTKV